MKALVLVGLLLLVPGVTPHPSQQPPRAHAERGIERLRERWSDRAEGERERLEKHLDEFQRLEKPARHHLLERARALRERELAAEQEMTAELRRQVEELGPELRRAELRERFREHGREFRSHLSKAQRERLESATPEQRRRYLQSLFEGRENASRRVLGKLREPLGLAASELQRLEHLTPPQLLHALRELGRRVDALRAERRPRSNR
ncbi:MAG: hypothetical protein EXS08_05220 [Planctomycetes bacterium]|nr:hypothetical protein [Planctomycetota bacterium]